MWQSQKVPFTLGLQWSRPSVLQADLAEPEVVEPQTTEPKAGDACNMGKVEGRNAQSHKLLSP